MRVLPNRFRWATVSGHSNSTARSDPADRQTNHSGLSEVSKQKTGHFVLTGNRQTQTHKGTAPRRVQTAFSQTITTGVDLFFENAILELDAGVPLWAESFGQCVSKQPFEPDTGHTDEGSGTVT